MSLFVCPNHSAPWKFIDFTAKSGKFKGQRGQMRVCALGDDDCQPTAAEKFVRDQKPAAHKPTAGPGRGVPVAVPPDPYKNRRAALNAACLFYRDVPAILEAAGKFETWLDRPFPAKVVPASQLVGQGGAFAMQNEEVEFEPGEM